MCRVRFDLSENDFSHWAHPVRFLSTMCPLVLLQVRFSVEGFITLITLVRFLPAVQLLMLNHVAFAAECFIAQVALEWFVGVVHGFVVFQRRFLRK